MVMWILYISLVTLFVFYKEIFRPDVLLIYLYMIYFITQTLFDKEDILNRFLSLLFMGYLIISCTTIDMVSYAEEIKNGVSIILLLILFRFINSEISFMGKSIMFLIAGISFMIGSNIIKKRIGGEKDE